MGQVFRATDTKLKRQDAIKILPPAVAADAERLARFQRQAEVQRCQVHYADLRIMPISLSDTRSTAVPAAPMSA